MLKKKAVVIDDEELCRVFLAALLEDHGFEVDSYATAYTYPFCSGEGESCQAERACADLLLTDNRMPVVSGLELVEQQQARGCKLAAGKRAVVSGSWSREDRQKAQELGCQVFDKPYDLKGINDWLARCRDSI